MTIKNACFLNAFLFYFLEVNNHAVRHLVRTILAVLDVLQFFFSSIFVCRFLWAGKNRSKSRLSILDRKSMRRQWNDVFTIFFPDFYRCCSLFPHVDAVRRLRYTNCRIRLFFGNKHHRALREYVVAVLVARQKNFARRSYFIFFVRKIL